MTSKKIWAKAGQIGSILTIIVCMLIGCERRNEVYLTRLSGDGEEAVLPAKEQPAETMVSQAGAAASEAGTGSLPAETSVPEKEQAVLMVHVCGAVENPGVYELPEGSRLYQAVEKAGGFTGNAARDYLNQAKTVTDGAKLYVPTTEEVFAAQQQGTLPSYWENEETQREDTQKDSGALQININTATEAQLCTLPGIGSSKAQSIIAYRDRYGGFGTIEDIMKVEGIKEGLFLKIRDSITVER